MLSRGDDEILVKEFVTSLLSGCSLKISQIIQNAANKSADRNEKAKQLSYVYLWFLEFLKVEREAELKTETETFSTFRTTLISYKSYN